MPTTLSASVREILARSTVDGCNLRLPDQLDRDAYLQVDRALRELGGKWNRAAKAHVFPINPAPLIAALTVGEILTGPNAVRDEGYVATPPDLASELLRYDLNVGDLEAGARVLEPSAGDGALVRAILAANPDVHVTAVEPNGERARALPRDERVTVHTTRFEDFDHRGELFDAVVMNPPFSVTGNRTIWIDHVRRAWQLVKPGGLLLAIVPGGYTFRTDKRHVAIRALVEEYGGARPLAADAFKPSGVGIQTVVITMDRPEAHLADDPAPLPPETPPAPTRSAPEAKPVAEPAGEPPRLAPVVIRPAPRRRPIPTASGATAQLTLF